MRPPHPARALAAQALLVLAGGALGSAVRAAAAGALDPRPGTGWPWGTLTVNLLGALALGSLLEGLSRRGPETPTGTRWRLLAGTGFCGGLTTCSGLVLGLAQLTGPAPGVATGYLGISLIGGAACAWAGIALAARTVPPRPISDDDAAATS